MELAPTRRDLARLAILAAVAVLFFVFVDPLAPFPVSGDAAPGLAVAAARLASLLGGALGAAGVYALARRWRASPDAALLAALTVFISPLYAAACAISGADAAAAVLAFAGLLAFLRGRERGADEWLAAASFFSGTAGLLRPVYILAAAGGALALARERRLGARAAAALLVPAAAAALARRGAIDAAGLSVGLAAARAAAGAQIAALSLFPLAFGLISARRASRSGTRGEKAALILAGVLAVAGWIRARGLPFAPAAFHRAGLGALTLAGAPLKLAGWWEGPLFWHAAAALALTATLAFLSIAFDAARGPVRRELLAAALFAAPPVAAALALGADRGFGPFALLPFAAAAAVAGERGSVWRLALGFFAAAALALVGSAGLSDYFAWNRARWQAAQAIAARGLPAESIDAGPGFGGAAPRAAVTFAPQSPRPGLEPAALVPYRSVLAPDGAAVFAFAEPRREPGSAELR
jgi:hypothetical protein